MLGGKAAKTHFASCIVIFLLLTCTTVVL